MGVMGPQSGQTVDLVLSRPAVVKPVVKEHANPGWVSWTPNPVRQLIWCVLARLSSHTLDMRDTQATGCPAFSKNMSNDGNHFACSLLASFL